MGFWGIEVKPGNPYPYRRDNAAGKLRVTQATLGVGSSTEKSILQCSAGHKNPVFLCSLLPNKIESCFLDLEFDSDDLVAFSVIGSRSIHLSGYVVADDRVDHRDDYDDCDSDLFGEEEDIADTETEESSEYDMEDDYADDFIDDSDIDMHPRSLIRNSGVVIEEILDDDKPENGDGQSKKSKKKNQIASLMDSKNSLQKMFVKGDTGIPVLESEDEDGFPISASDKGKSDSQKLEAEQTDKKTETANKKKAKDGDNASSLKRKVENVYQDEQLEGKKKKKKKKKSKEHGKGESSHVTDNDNETNVARGDEKQLEDVRASPDLNLDSQVEDELEGKLSKEKAEKKKKQKKKKTKERDGVINQNVTTSERGEKQTEAKPSQVRSHDNGLVVEELSMGKPDGKRAAPGKQVSVKFIGKLRKDGKIVDSNAGRAPLKFRLGVGQVIKGWDVGINGMRIGDKRRITVPPSMGYGDKRVGPIPQNSWLVFDVELVDVR